MLTPCLFLKANHKDHRMHTLYDSETFTVTHMLANAQSQNMSPEAASGPGHTALSDVKTDQYPQGVPMLARHGFEIVDKRSGKEVYLDGSWAELFQQHIVAWQVNMPTQEEVEDTLSQYAELAQNPVLVH
ncbi:MAG: hypothetical protein RLZZ454_1156 [Pseudomonadota bacterium]|jgi:hypothetical protein